MTNKVFTIQLLSAVVLFGPVGCSQNNREAYAPPPEAAGWSDLSTGKSVTSDEGYRLLVPEATEGLFPASIAVARLTQANGNAGQLALAMKPEVDFLAWNSVFDDYRGVSEVFPLNEMDLDGGEVSADNLLAAADALKAGLLLLYTESHTQFDRCSLSGVLYDVRSRRALAAVHASSLISDPVAPDERIARTASGGAHEARDPRLVAVGAFESHVRDCLRRLMTKDRSKSVGPVDGWIPNPIDSLIWPSSYQGYPRTHR